ncbi:NAD-binding protein [Salimicrobium halophilum]|uniref:Dipicolinate synthase subunit A n=1 Tax=Salimicrobium halophilum TaxID=86666 RepID=A0A1G8Q855_9BACI|nr:NAD-binding protein [Salimicrobium halophilum]SDJ00954.1 dipicolinate synthase subunit A [Salimicrobium halophilum]
MVCPEKILVLGDGKRQKEMRKYWKVRGVTVWNEEDSFSPEELAAIVFPVKVTHDTDRYVKLLSKISASCIVCTGILTEEMNRLQEKTGKTIIPLMEMDSVAIENSIPTAEGILQYVMEHTEKTIHRSDILVVGYGRVGETLVHRLLALQAKVTVLTKEEKDIARAKERGADAREPDSFSPGPYDVVINTAPALTVDKRLMDFLEGEAVIFDAASAPGGVDREEAEKQEIQTFHILGIPEKTSPVTAGEVICRAVERLLEKTTRRSEEWN